MTMETNQSSEPLESKKPKKLFRAKHGARSERNIRQFEEEMRVNIEQALEGEEISPKLDKFAISLLAQNLAKIKLMDDYMAKYGLFDSEGKTRDVVKVYWAAVNSASRLCAQLGLTPQSRSRLKGLITGTGGGIASRTAKHQEEEKHAP